MKVCFFPFGASTAPSVGMGAGQPRNRGSICGRGKGWLLSPNRCEWPWGPPSPLISGGGGSFLGVKHLGHAADCPHHQVLLPWRAHGSVSSHDRARHLVWPHWPALEDQLCCAAVGDTAH